MNSLETFIPYAITTIIALAAFILSLKADRRKTGTDVRCSFIITHSITASERWISALTLQNEKDRSIAIHKIFLLVNHGTYVLVDDFTHNPLVIPPYEVWHKQYPEVHTYASNSQRVTSVLDHKPKRWRVLLTTSQGKHFAKSPRRHFDPVAYLLNKNYGTLVIQPIRLTHGDQSYGDNVRYICTLTHENGQVATIPILETSHIPTRIGDIIVPPEHKISADSLQQFITSELPQVGVNIIDLKCNHENIHQDFRHVAPYEPVNWFKYNVLYRAMTLKEKWLPHRRWYPKKKRR